MLDKRGRPMHDLRISVTDRCNFRCVYCMPREVFGPDFAYVPRHELLTHEEIARVANVFVSLGVEKIRITGGEPLLRRNLERLIEMLVETGVQDLALTTNGSLLTREKAQALRNAGLTRITISLDALDDATFRALCDTEVHVGRVLDAIECADAVGLRPIKIDAVVKRGANDREVINLARRFRGTGHIVRFIEYMDVGNSNQWRHEDVVPAREIVSMIAAEWPVEPLDANYFGEVAERWRYTDGAGEFGVISSVTQPFCGSCTRARLSSEGALFTCLFSERGTDLRALIRGGATDDQLREAISRVWVAREDRYSEIRSEETRSAKRVEMSHIGG
jgi:cyclic pyranopterin phosphate synthase